MKVSLNFHTLEETKTEKVGDKILQEIGFSLVGRAFVPQDVLIIPDPNKAIGNEVKNQILTELVNLLQLELYGKVLSNEPGEEKSE
jgi:hypothetical protein